MSFIRLINRIQRRQRHVGTIRNEEYQAQRTREAAFWRSGKGAWAPWAAGNQACTNDGRQRHGAGSGGDRGRRTGEAALWRSGKGAWAPWTAGNQVCTNDAQQSPGAWSWRTGCGRDDFAFVASASKGYAQRDRQS